MIHSCYRKDDRQDVNGSTIEFTQTYLIEERIKKIFEFIEVTIDNFKNNIDYVWKFKNFFVCFYNYLWF